MARAANAIPSAIAAADAKSRKPGQVARIDRTLESTQVSEGGDLTPFRSPSINGCSHEPGTPGRLALTPINSERSFSMYKDDDNQGEEEEERGPRTAKINIDLKSAVARSNMARSASRSSNYSPPSLSVPEAPKALRCDTTMSEATSEYFARKLSTDLSHSPIVAPWNNHQSEMTVLGDGNDYPAKRARIAPSTDLPLPGFIDGCDNYGCNNLYSHFDCPLEKECWGCHSKNHVTSDCPMTCTNCCSEGHSRKYCEDFETDPYTGIARPRRT